MTKQKLIKELSRLRVETGSLACLGCECERNCSTHGCRILREAEMLIANVAPMRHARWNRPYISWFFPLKIKDSHCYCTYCGNPVKHRKTTNYCSYCGAKMDGGIEDATD